MATRNRKLNAVKKSTSSKKKKTSKDTHIILDRQLNTLRNKIDKYEEDLEKKNLDIKKYKNHLYKCNAFIVKLTSQIEENLEHLHSFHHNLVPDQLPLIPNCTFSFTFNASYKGVGKDFFQVNPIQNKKMHFNIIMSSCASHIISSLLFSSRIKAMSQLGVKISQPSELLKVLASEMHKKKAFKKDIKSIDLFYAIMNRKTFKLSYCSVGNITSFLFSHATKKLTELPPLAPIFDLDSVSSISNKKISFNPKDQLIICSPGVLSTVNKKGEAFGKKRLIEAIHSVDGSGAHYLKNHIMHLVKFHSKSKTVSRDQSIIVMEIEDKILKLT